MRPTIIVQITEAYLKVAALRSGGSFLEADACVVEPVAGINDALVAEKLGRILKDLKLHQPLVIISLARNAVTVRNLHLPSRQAPEIAQMIDLKLARLVPYKKEDVVFDFRVVGTDDAGYSRVILAVVKTEIVRRCASIVEKAGGAVDRIVLGSYGVWQKMRGLAAAAGPDDVFLALDIDTDFTDFMIFSPAAPVFSRTINIGARSLIENKDGVTLKFISELKQSLMMFYNEEMNKRPEKIFVSGGKVDEGLLRRIASEFSVVVESAGPGLAGTLEDVSSVGITRVGARDRDELNFVLAEIQVRKTLSRTVRELVLLGGVCVYLLSLGYVFYWGRIYHQQNYLARVKAKTASVEKTLGDLPGKLKKIEFVKGRLEERKAVLFVIVELQKVVPSKVAVQSVVMDDRGKVIVRGQAEELSDVFKFLDNLQKEPYFKDVQTKSTKKKKVMDRDLIDFELNFILG
jgi:Tfp pilus assembly PilM family ATPase